MYEDQWLEAAFEDRITGDVDEFEELGWYNDDWCDICDNRLDECDCEID